VEAILFNAWLWLQFYCRIKQILLKKFEKKSKNMQMMRLKETFRSQGRFYRATTILEIFSRATTILETFSRATTILETFSRATTILEIFSRATTILEIFSRATIILEIFSRAFSFRVFAQ
jgi:hypothetical protein